MILFHKIKRLGLETLFHQRKIFDMLNMKNLRHDHVKLTAIAGELSEIIAQSAPPQPRELYQIRMRLASELIRHLKSEDWTLYPTLLASRNESVALVARAFSASMGGLASEFKTYSERWGAGAIMRNWTGYQSETFEILRALTLRIAREERDLYPLLDLPPMQAAA